MNEGKEMDGPNRMNCAEFRDVLHELDRPGTRGADQLESAMAHAESCGDCGVALVEAESLGYALSTVARETARMPGAARVEAALLREFARTKEEAKTGLHAAPAWRGMGWRIAAVGIAAALFLALGTFIYERNLSMGKRSNEAQVASNPANVAPAVAANGEVNSAAANSSTVQETAENANTETVSGSASPVANSGAKKAGAASSEEAGTEYATDYVPLPYADDPAALEGGSVVRVTLARSALASYGLPVDGMGAGDRVTADMIVSEDGTPQAIRLVAQAD